MVPTTQHRTHCVNQRVTAIAVEPLFDAFSSKHVSASAISSLCRPPSRLFVSAAAAACKWQADGKWHFHRTLRERRGDPSSFQRKVLLIAWSHLRASADKLVQINTSARRRCRNTRPLTPRRAARTHTHTHTRIQMHTRTCKQMQTCMHSLPTRSDTCTHSLHLSTSVLSALNGSVYPWF